MKFEWYKIPITFLYIKVRRAPRRPSAPWQKERIGQIKNV